MVEGAGEEEDEGGEEEEPWEEEGEGAYLEVLVYCMQTMEISDQFNEAAT